MMASKPTLAAKEKHGGAPAKANGIGDDDDKPMAKVALYRGHVTWAV
jgi:hypothetical protein